MLRCLSVLTSVIVGAGQAGLMVAARFKQMGIRSIVLEKNARVGDNWRKRYPSLSLHTPKTNHACESILSGLVSVSELMIHSPQVLYHSCKLIGHCVCKYS